MVYTAHGILQARILGWVPFSPSPGDLPNPGTEPRSPTLHADDMIVYIENPKDSTRKLLELINEYSKVAGYITLTQKSLASYTLIMRK